MRGISTWVNEDGKWIPKMDYDKSHRFDVGTKIGGTRQEQGFDQTPSYMASDGKPGDIINAAQDGYEDHFVLSRNNDQIYYYNGTEDENKTYSGKFPLKEFYDVKEGKPKN